MGLVDDLKAELKLELQKFAEMKERFLQTLDSAKKYIKDLEAQARLFDNQGYKDIARELRKLSTFGKGLLAKCELTMQSVGQYPLQVVRRP